METIISKIIFLLCKSCLLFFKKVIIIFHQKFSKVSAIVRVRLVATRNLDQVSVSPKEVLSVQTALLTIILVLKRGGGE